MGAFLDKPKTDKQTETGDGNGLRYVVSSEQGWRIEMEDAHSAVIGVSEAMSDWSFFGVYDGHAGSKVSGYCAQQLLVQLLASIQRHDEQQKADASSPTAAASGWRQRLAVDEPAAVELVRQSLVAGFLQADEAMLEDKEVMDDRSGSTAVCALLAPTHLFVANCGDSRALLYSGGAIAVTTEDHKPANPGEKARIESAGGNVLMQRVNGSLGVSRALGDFEYKHVLGLDQRQQLVSPEPDVYVHRRQPERDEFLVLACDGVWDVFNNDDLCAFVRSRLRVTDNLTEIANQVLDTCFHMGSKDNMSIVLVLFPGAPSVDDAAVQREEAMKNKITAAIEEYIELQEHTNKEERASKSESMTTQTDVPSSAVDAADSGGGAGAEVREGSDSVSEPSVNTNDIVNFVRQQDVADLPDGAGIWSMWQFIEDSAIARVAARRRAASSTE